MKKVHKETKTDQETIQKGHKMIMSRCKMTEEPQNGHKDTKWSQSAMCELAAWEQKRIKDDQRNPVFLFVCKYIINITQSYHQHLNLLSSLHLINSTQISN